MDQLELDRDIGNRSLRSAKLVFAAVLMSAVLSACGGDSDPAPVASAAPAPTGSAAAPTGSAPSSTTPPASAGLEGTPSNSGASGSMTLSWMPPTSNEDGTPLTLTGYKIYWGLTEGNYPNSVTIDNPGLSRYVVEDLTPATWYFVATALSADGESSPSNVLQMQVN